MARNSVFQFKQFCVDQSDCAMKINTDGVLLAASTIRKGICRVLDIGTGTGVIALMLAQQYQSAVVEAVEIDGQAAKRAKLNFLQSPFFDRLLLHSGSFEEMHVQEPFDLIISNPPFYTDSLHNPDLRRKLARHADLLFFEQLLCFAAENLMYQGQLRLILPVDLADKVVAYGAQFGLLLEDSMAIRSYADTAVIRRIITLQKCSEIKATESVFTIYERKGEYTNAYKTLLAPFFLAF